MTDGIELVNSSYPLGWAVINGLEMYYLPVLVVIGGLGNCLSVYVVCASKMRRTSSSLYLAALALSDTGFLLSVCVAWLGIVNIHIMNEQGLCQFFVYWPYVCSFLSSWFVVAFTVERFVAVCYPLRRQWMCTVNRAKTLIGSVSLAGIALCCPSLFYARPGPLRHSNSSPNANISSSQNSSRPIVCQIEEGWENWASASNYFDTFVTFALPFCIIVILNSLIIRAVCRVDSVRSSLKARTAVKESPPAVHQTRVTKMLLIVSTVFFCFNLPAYVMRVYAYLKKEGTVTELEVLVQKGCNLLFNTNFGISFGLYCASGQNFRAAVGQLFHCRRQRTLLRVGLSKRFSANQAANAHGNETIRMSGSTSGGDHTILCDKPWKDSFQMRAYPSSRTTLQPEAETEIEEYCPSTATFGSARDCSDGHF